jgi:hypothetical protein
MKPKPIFVLQVALLCLAGCASTSDDDGEPEGISGDSALNGAAASLVGNWLSETAVPRDAPSAIQRISLYARGRGEEKLAYQVERPTTVLLSDKVWEMTAKDWGYADVENDHVVFRTVRTSGNGTGTPDPRSFKVEGQGMSRRLTLIDMRGERKTYFLEIGYGIASRNDDHATNRPISCHERGDCLSTYECRQNWCVEKQDGF